MSCSGWLLQASRGARISKLEPRCNVAPAEHAEALAPCPAWLRLSGSVSPLFHCRNISQARVKLPFMIFQIFNDFLLISLISLIILMRLSLLLYKGKVICINNYSEFYYARY